MFSLSKRGSIVRSTLLLTAVNLAMRAAGMVFQVFLSRRVGTAGLGLLTLTMTVGVLAMTAGAGGVRVASMYLCAAEHSRSRPGGVRAAMRCCLLYGLAVSCAVGAAVFALSGFLARVWLLDERAASSLRIIGAFLPVTCLWGVFGGYFTAVGKVGRLVAVELLERALSMALTAAALVLWAGGDTERSCMAIIGGSSASSALSLVVIAALYRREIAGRGAPRAPGMGRRLVRLAVPLGLADCLRSGLSTLEHLLIPRGLTGADGSYESSLAAYGTIHGMVFPVLMFPACVLYSLSDLLVPELAGAAAAGRTRRIRGLARRCLRTTVLFSCAVSGALFVSAQPLGLLVYRSADAGRYLALFAPLVPMLYLDAIIDGMLKGLGEQVYCVRCNTLTSLLDVLLLLTLLPRYGIGGYFFSFTATHAVNFFLSAARLLRVTDYDLAPGHLARAALSALGAGAAALIVRAALPPLPPFWRAAAPAGAYLAAFWALARLTGALEPGALSSLLAPLRRQK